MLDPVGRTPEPTVVRTRATRTALPLLACALTFAVPAGAARATQPATAAAVKTRHYVLGSSNGKAVLTWKVGAGILRGSHGRASVLFGGIGGTGLLRLAPGGTGGGTTRGDLEVIRAENAIICGQGKACAASPASVCVNEQTSEAGGVSMRVEGARVKVTWNFPFIESHCALTLSAAMFEKDSQKAGRLSKYVGLGLFAKKRFTLKLKGTVPIKKTLPGGGGTVTGTYVWQYTITFVRKK